jgi:hypothetical protein
MTGPFSAWRGSTWGYSVGAVFQAQQLGLERLGLPGDLVNRHPALAVIADRS